MENYDDNFPDRIADFYYGRTVFISGGTGFLGKIFIEKILRSCSGVKRIYLLMRTKKGKTSNQRIEELFYNPLFNLLKQQQPNAPAKCSVITGDITEINLGISSDDRRKLQNEVDIIIHSAASTRFDLTMKTALTINTRGTKFMLDLANECKKLKVFVYVSTAYAYPNEQILYERPYDPPVNPHEALSAINWIEEDDKGLVTKALLKNMPNTYTFSKALAEALVVEQFEKLPVIITRPSIVIPVWREPSPGWCNNLQGPMGLFVAAGKGIIRSMYINGDACADLLPADIVINGIILASWEFYTFKQNRIFNITNSSEFPVTWEEIIEIGKAVCLTDMPFNGIVWYPGGSMKQSKFLHVIAFYLFQIVPALLIDALLILLRYKPVLYQIQRRIEKGGEMFEFYTTRSWNFDHKNALIGRTHLNPKENLIYKIDGEGLELRKYFVDCILSTRRYILKETDDMIPAAKKNLKIMWALDKFVKILLTIFLLRVLHKLIFNSA